MRTCVVALVVVLLAMLCVQSAESKSTDLMAWTPPAEVPLFVEKIPVDKFASEMAEAKALAKKVAAERALLPERGVIVDNVDPKTPADTAGVKVGDIILSIDEIPTLKMTDVNSNRKPQVQKIAYYSRKRGNQTLEIKPGRIGFYVHEYVRDNDLIPESLMLEKRWADDFRMLNLYYEQYPNLAETVLARAVAAGLTRSNALERAASTLALRTAQYDRAMAIAHYALGRAQPEDVEPLRRDFCTAAILNGKWEAALTRAQQSSDDQVKACVEILQRLVEAHKALPDSERLAPSPIVQAATLFHDDLTPRLDTFELTGTPAEIKQRRFEIEPRLHRMCDFVPFPFGTQFQRYYAINLLPEANNLELRCRFRIAPTKGVGVIEFQVLEHEKDQPTPNLFSFGIGIQSYTTMSVIVPEVAPALTPDVLASAVTKLKVRPIPCNNYPKFTHALRMCLVGSMIEIELDGQRVACVPHNLHGPKFVRLNFGGVQGEMFDFTYYDLLTPEERKLKVDPEVNKTFRNGFTRLHRIPDDASLESFRALLEHGADPNIKDQFEYTPILRAVERNRLDILTLLLEKGAKPELANRDWQDAGDLALKLKHKEIADYLLKRFPGLGKGAKAVKPPHPPDEF